MDIGTGGQVAFRTADLAIVIATLLGPILAVQIQKWLEKSRAINDRRNQIFRVLMATRAAMLAPSHVEALNAIPVEFYGSSGKLKEINDKWKEYLDHHITNFTTGDAWMQKRIDLFIDLLLSISQFLGYKFNKPQLSRDIYSPRAHGDLENEQAIIRQGLVKLLNGETTLPMAITQFPAMNDQTTLENQAAIQNAVLEWLNGQRQVKVESVATK